MADLEKLVADAAHAAENDGDVPDDVDGGDTSEEIVETTEEIVHDDDATVDDGDGSTGADEGKAGTKPAESADKPAKVEAVDEAAKALDELGIKAPKDGERENRLPYSRIKKIFGNAQKKWTDAHAGELKTRDEKLTVAEKRAKDADNWDRLIATDPDRAMQALAVLHPVYRKYLTGAPAEAAKPEAAKPSTIGPRPEPDQQFTDGSTGYSAAGLQKLLDWNAATAREAAVTEAETRFNARFGGMEKQYQAQQVIAQQRPAIEAMKQRASKTWGKMFDDDYALGSNPATQDKSEILAAMKANPEMPFDAVVAMVLAPKQATSLQADRNKMRAELIKEGNARKGAAATAAPAATKAAAIDPDSPRSIEDVVREAAQKLARR